MGPGRMTPEEERREIRAFLRLRQMQGLGDLGIRRWVLEHGSGCAALEAARRQGELWPRQDPEREVQAWEEEGFHVLPQTSPRYPPSVLHLVDPPPLLFLKGRTELLSSPTLAIVGSRRATEVGRRTAEGMAGILAGAGITVVSGMALGIDGAAHQGALRPGWPHGRRAGLWATSSLPSFPPAALATDWPGGASRLRVPSRGGGPAAPLPAKEPDHSRSGPGCGGGGGRNEEWGAHHRGPCPGPGAGCLRRAGIRGEPPGQGRQRPVEGRSEGAACPGLPPGGTDGPLPRAPTRGREAWKRACGGSGGAAPHMVRSVQRAGECR